MGLITFLSDFGDKDHYVPVVKATILKINPALRIIDITHHVPSCNLPYTAFILKQTYKEFAPGTVHIIAVGSDTENNQAHIAAAMKGHFFICPDNGILSLISKQPPSTLVDLSALPKRQVHSSLKISTQEPLPCSPVEKPCQT